MKLIEQGRNLPDAAYSKPEIPEWHEFYWEAFSDLTTERQIGMGLGPIPRSAIMAYAVECELYGDAVEHFSNIIRSVDIEYLQMFNSTGKDNQIPITDVEGTKQLLGRLSERAKAARGKSL